MKIIKYAQSCFLLNSKGINILIDPSSYNETSVAENLKDINIILISHKHADHCDIPSIKTIIKNNPNIKIYSNSEVCSALKEERIKCNEVKVGDTIEEDGIKIEVVKAMHGYLPIMKGRFVKGNNGYIIDDKKIRVYHCSDTICFENDIKADVVLVPICGHGVVMEPLVAVAFCQAINPKLVIPMHYDSEKHYMGTDRFEEEVKKTDLNYKILKPSKSIEI